MAPAVFWRRILCLVGLHDWQPVPSDARRCRHCGRLERWYDDGGGWANGHWLRG
jgi:hypothetical protein